jgi:hypothetical protein
VFLLSKTGTKYYEQLNEAIVVHKISPAPKTLFLFALSQEPDKILTPSKALIRHHGHGRRSQALLHLSVLRGGGGESR